MKTQDKKMTCKGKPVEPARLSKLGIAMRDKTLPVFGKVVDMKAVLN